MKEIPYCFVETEKIYIDGMGKDPLETLYICQNNRFNAFDDEMASATVKAFERCNNAEKCRFPGYFERIWENWHVIAEIDKQKIHNKVFKYVKNWKN